MPSVLLYLMFLAAAFVCGLQPNIGGLVTDLVAHHNSVCVYLISSEDAHAILQLQYHLMPRYTSAIVDLRTLNDTSQGLICLRNRPWIVIANPGEEIRRDLQQISWGTKLSVPRWLLLLDKGTTVEDFFSDVNIPFDCEFLVAQWSSYESVSLTEVYRVRSDLPLQTYYWGSWSSNNGIKRLAGVLYNRRNNLQGIEFKAASVHNPPNSYVYKNYRGEIILDGIFQKLWFDMERRLNFSTKGYQTDLFGAPLGNGSWNGLVGMVHRKEMDVGLCALYMTLARTYAINYFTPVQISRAYVMIRTSDHYSSTWTVFLTPFSGALWLAVLGSILFYGFSLSVMNSIQSRYGNRNSDVYSLYESLHCVTGIYCGQGHWTTPKSPSLRIIYWMTFITAITLLSAFSAKFVANFTIKKVNLPFTNFQGLLEDNSYDFVVEANSGLYSTFYGSPFGIMKKIFNKKLLPMKEKLPLTVKSGMRRLCDERLTLMADSGYYSDFGKIMPCHISILPGASFPIYLAFIVPKNSPYREIVNYNFKKMHRSGIARRLFLQSYNPPMVWNPPFKSVGMEEAFSILSLYLAGVVMSCAVLFIEKVYYNFLKVKCTPPTNK